MATVRTFAINIEDKYTTPLIPREILFGPLDKTDVAISPNGQYISYLAKKDRRKNLWIVDSNDIENIKVVTDDPEGITNYFWAHDNKHLLYQKDNNGDENFRLYSYNLDTNITKLLTPENTKVQIYGRGARKPNEILIGLNNRDKRYHDVYRLNLIDYSTTLIAHNNTFSNFIVDRDLNIRFATLINNEGEREYFQYKNNRWLFFMKVSSEDTLGTRMFRFDNTGSKVYLLDSRGLNTTALKILDLNKGKLTLIAEDPRADISIFTVHPATMKVQAVAINYDKVTYKILDNSIKKDMEYFKNINLNNINIINRTLNDQIWLLSSYNDTISTKYYKYDRSNKQIKFLFSNKVALEQYHLAPMIPVVIKSRDNLDLVNYITLPKNITLYNKIYPIKPVPLVLFVHGGPHVREVWGMHWAHQWLADRGYAVLSVNFRGSSGFGKKFFNAGNRQWGLKMQDDLIDAANWAITNKIADPKKIAIMGGSYGGYATLVGLSFTPNVFACGIDMAGPTNLLTLLRNIPQYWAPIINQLKVRVGPWDTAPQREMLKQVSPLTFASKIIKPLLIMQGANDPRVKQAEADQIVQEMTKHNIPVIYALYKNEGHGFSKAANRLSFFAIAEQFLAKFLGGAAEPIDFDLNDPNLILNGKPPSTKLLIELLDKNATIKGMNLN
ncbi:S9 family peptidase [Candidatus Tisiphia endosymbiont of Beris chalybata]|uniref:S9 family peptidase n=1 Tax=Candidatus Tisiphia endosymbiont of Beris chalybata TaxID=3066262 RepID=UPI00312C9B72